MKSRVHPCIVRGFLTPYQQFMFDIEIRINHGLVCPTRKGGKRWKF